MSSGEVGSVVEFCPHFRHFKTFLCTHFVSICIIVQPAVNVDVGRFRKACGVLDRGGHGHLWRTEGRTCRPAVDLSARWHLEAGLGSCCRAKHAASELSG